MPVTEHTQTGRLALCELCGATLLPTDSKCRMCGSQVQSDESLSREATLLSSPGLRLYAPALLIAPAALASVLIIGYIGALHPLQRPLLKLFITYSITSLSTATLIMLDAERLGRLHS